MNYKTLLILSLIFCACSTERKPEITKERLTSNTGSLLQAISILDEKRAWVSGHQATFCRTLDGGKTWKVFTHPSDTLQFRDLHAFDADHVVLMSAGPGASSRIIHFDASNSSFTESYVMPHKEGFLNTIEFWDDQNGLAFGDSFNQQLFVLRTQDGGRSWQRIDPNKLPQAGEGEGGFAASGTCITTLKGGNAYIATGAGGHSRILITPDYGESWETVESPLPKGDAAGIFSIRMVNGQMGMIAGGDLNRAGEYMNNVAFTTNSGKVWALANQPITTGTFYGSDLIETKDGFLAMVCGPAGVDYSFDLGKSWANLDTLNYWSVDLYNQRFGYAVGTEGKILRIEIN